MTLCDAKRLYTCGTLQQGVNKNLQYYTGNCLSLFPPPRSKNKTKSLEMTLNIHTKLRKATDCQTTYVSNLTETALGDTIITNFNSLINTLSSECSRSNPPTLTEDDERAGHLAHVLLSVEQTITANRETSPSLKQHHYDKLCDALRSLDCIPNQQYTNADICLGIAKFVQLYDTNSYRHELNPLADLIPRKVLLASAHDYCPTDESKGKEACATIRSKTENMITIDESNDARDLSELAKIIREQRESMMERGHWNPLNRSKKERLQGTINSLISAKTPNTLDFLYSVLTELSLDDTFVNQLNKLFPEAQEQASLILAQEWLTEQHSALGITPYSGDDRREARPTTQVGGTQETKNARESSKKQQSGTDAEPTSGVSVASLYKNGELDSRSLRR